jgi:putative acetyltransferase
LLTIAIESPLTPDGLALLAGSDAALSEVFAPEENFTLDPEQLAVPAIRFFVARSVGVPVGCVALMRCDGFGEVKRLFVAPAGRGLGVARALMAALEADAGAQGLAAVLLETSDRLVPAVTLYSSLGYQVRGRFGDYDDHPASLFMGKEIGAA